MATYPFSEINSRIFYACQAVLVKERNDQTGDTSPEDGTYLTGVTSVGINGSFPSVSLADIGRAQRKYHFYAPQDFDITIERRIDVSSDFFYKVSPSDYAASSAGYQNTHILSANNIGVQGEVNSDGKSLRNYDVTILYGQDQFDKMSDGTKVFSVTYRNCLITSISYSIGVDSVTESITLITRGVTYNSEQTVEDYELPESAQSGTTIKRADFDLLESSPYSVLPTEVITMFKAQNLSGGFDILDEEFIFGINSVTIDVGIDYSEIKDIGQWAGGFTAAGGPPTAGGGSYDQGKQNVWRYVNLPVAVTAAFTGTARQPFVQTTPAAGAGSPGPGLPITDTTFSAANGVPASTDWTQVDREIKLVAKTYPPAASATYFVWDLGKRNYLTDFSFSGADTGGGNLEATMSYQNDFSDIVLVKDTNVFDLPAPTSPY